MSEILVGVDGTAGAEDALAFAEQLAGATGATLRLATAFPYDDTPSRMSNGAFRDALRADAMALLDRLADAGMAKEAVADVSPPACAARDRRRARLRTRRRRLDASGADRSSAAR